MSAEQKPKKIGVSISIPKTVMKILTEEQRVALKKPASHSQVEVKVQSFAGKPPPPTSKKDEQQLAAAAANPVLHPLSIARPPKQPAVSGPSLPAVIPSQRQVKKSLRFVKETADMKKRARAVSPKLRRIS